MAAPACLCPTTQALTEALDVTNLLADRRVVGEHLCKDCPAGGLRILISSRKRGHSTPGVIMLTKTDTTGESAEYDLALVATQLREPARATTSTRSRPGGSAGAPNSDRQRPHLSARADRCACAACGEHFNSTFAFDFHRTGDWTRRRCRDRKEMGQLGMRLNEDRFWVSAANRNPTLWCSTSSRNVSRPLPNHGGAREAEPFAVVPKGQLQGAVCS
jgi:hypothetical protein